MKKKSIIAVCVLLIIGVGLVLGYRFMSTKDVVQLKEVSGLVLEKGYDSEDIKELLEGIPQKKMHAKWGDPDGHLSGQ